MAAGVFRVASPWASPHRSRRSFRRNPVLLAPAQDPQVALIDGLYYYCESNAAGIFIRASRDFRDLQQSRPQRVWAPPASGWMAHNVWAPELHLIDGRCHIYFAADDGRNENHRMGVLVAAGRDPLGAYTLHGPLETDGWAIDGTPFADAAGNWYFVWSGWPGAQNGQQNLYLSRMASPTQLTGSRVLLAEPDQAWERKALPLCEGPQVLQREGRTIIVYSGSGSWTQHYALGLLVHEGGDLLDRAAWRKTGPVFQANRHAWGIGHCGFTTAPDGRDWILYHCKTSRRDGWIDREVRAQPFDWNPVSGLPDFGRPGPRHAPLEPVTAPRRRRRTAGHPVLPQPALLAV